MADLGTNVPVAAPIDTDSAGRGGTIATQAVMRVLCPQINSMGTGFLHQSGNIITAEHVVHGCQQADLLQPGGTQIAASVLAVDLDLDLAILQPKTPITATPLPISGQQNFSIGAHVSTWGFPGGYNGLAPMLSVGYLSAISAKQTTGGQIIQQWVVNAAFNSGNSGGPLLLIETGEVIGVISSKLAPIAPEAASALQYLENNKSGLQATATRPDGTTFQMSEGQVVAMVLNDLRKQVQLVIGHAVLLQDLTAFLGRQGIAA